jgi:hypothetical protein
MGGTVVTAVARARGCGGSAGYGAHASANRRSYASTTPAARDRADYSDAAYAPEASVITIQGGRDRPESRQVVRPVGARSRNAMNFAGAFAAKHMKSASTCTMPHPGSKRGCSTSFGKFGSRLEARAQAAGGTGANDALRP